MKVEKAIFAAGCFWGITASVQTYFGCTSTPLSSPQVIRKYFHIYSGKKPTHFILEAIFYGCQRRHGFLP